ncbi:hypothetical protein B0H13DRAFT_2307149 [Mycena leptocephala]|nr:hypothetical protein B0H13DRAFT_2307149 [Mycena leptocephala]
MLSPASTQIVQFPAASSKNSKKPERAGLAMVLYVRTPVFLRRTIKEYLADVSPDGNFDKRTFFPGRFIYEDDDGRKRKARGVQRPALQDLLHKWLSATHAVDPLRAVRPASFILDAKAIKKLSTVHPDRMKSVEDVATALEETSDWTTQWGAAVFSVIANYDSDLRKSEESETESAPPVRRKVKGIQVGKTTEDEYVPAGKRARTVGTVLTEIPLNLRRSTRLQKPAK